MPGASQVDVLRAAAGPRLRRRLAHLERPDARTLPVAAAVAQARVPLVLLAVAREQARAQSSRLAEPAAH